MSKATAALVGLGLAMVVMLYAATFQGDSETFFGAAPAIAQDAGAIQYDATGQIIDHPYAVDDCRVLDTVDESFHEGSAYWYPIEGDGLERVYSYGCFL
jgi:hypothetical protein